MDFRFWCESSRAADITAMTGFDPDVWSDRALQEDFFESGMCGLASMYQAFDWSLLCSGPSWISARVAPGDVDAIILTHCHADHILGIVDEIPCFYKLHGLFSD